MKILISADMEGATGVTWPADCEPGAPEWQRRRTFKAVCTLISNAVERNYG
jgi:D-aminopeptidase